MTGKEVFGQAMRLLGYTDTLGDLDSAQNGELYKRGLAVLNQLLCDLSLSESGTMAPPLTSLRQDVPISEQTARGVLPYGVAMLLAAAEGDGDNQQLFAALYDQKRVAVRRTYERCTDTLPRGCDV
ncbi:MAG: hypothetical protein IJO75_05805 [Clostridia bacterium]|nr:hypothetical protein [Clostridia bacterium]